MRHVCLFEFDSSVFKPGYFSFVLMLEKKSGLAYDLLVMRDTHLDIRSNKLAIASIILGKDTHPGNSNYP